MYGDASVLRPANIMIQPLHTNGQYSSSRLHILIIGGGIGGLAAATCLSDAGHTVTVFEAAHKLREVGAGLQVSPNVSRLLFRWGLADRLNACAVSPEALVFRRYDGEVVGRSRWGQSITDEFGAPYMHIHRADLHRILLQRCRQSPRVSFRLNARVQSLDPNPNPKVALALTSGEIYEGDLIVGADGVHSLARQVICERDDLAQHTGEAAYRALLPTNLMMDDPELKALVDTPELTTWMGPGRHVMGYCVRAKHEYNLIMSHPDDGAVEDYRAEGDVNKMREDFADFEPRVRKLLDRVSRTFRWRLSERAPLTKWVHRAGRVVLLGDACHPMLPYRAQGAAMAIEDAAVLGGLLSYLARSGSGLNSNSSNTAASSGTSDPLTAAHLPTLLAAYEKLRLPRTTETQETSALNRYTFHLPDGAEQRARDASMRRAMRADAAALAAETDAAHEALSDSGHGRPGSASGTSASSPAASHAPSNFANANQWADRKKNQEQYGYDADAVVVAWWDREGRAQLERLAAALRADAMTVSSSSTGSRSSTGKKKASFWQRLAGKRMDDES